MTWPRVLATSAAILVLGAIALYVLQVILTRQDRNLEAIRVSCVLLQTAILQSGASAIEARELSDAAKAQRELTGLYVGVIGRNMRPAEVIEAAKLRKRIVAGGGAVTLPKCDEIVAHPERVKALDILEKKRNTKAGP